jgi:hypothetical protein
LVEGIAEGDADLVLDLTVQTFAYARASGSKAKGVAMSTVLVTESIVATAESLVRLGLLSI